MIAGGRADSVGNSRSIIEGLIAKARGPAATAITADLDSAEVAAGVAPRGGADVWLVRYDPRALEITPKRGDNKGQALVQRNVVREIVRLGSWRGKPTAYRLPTTKLEGLAMAVIVQAPKGGKILGVAARP